MVTTSSPIGGVATRVGSAAPAGSVSCGRSALMARAREEAGVEGQGQKIADPGAQLGAVRGDEHEVGVGGELEQDLAARAARRGRDVGAGDDCDGLDRGGARVRA